MEVDAGEEERDVSAAEGPEGTDSQIAVSMAVLWKPGSAAHCCSEWNFNASHSPGTQETANPQTRQHQTCRCLIRAQFLIQPVCSAPPPGEERTSKPKSAKFRACYTSVSLLPSGPLRIVLKVEISLISSIIFDLLLYVVC